MTSRSPLHACAAALAATAIVTGCQVSQPCSPAGACAPRTPITSASDPGGAAAGSALSLVATLRVQGRGPKTGYAREQYGPAWADTDRNGCDTRNDVLARDLQDETFRAGTADCVVLSGVLTEPYTGRRVTFSKQRAGDLQIDHVVALSDSWQKGAAQWQPGERLAFANDPLNLLAVSGVLNQQKSDSDAASWLPPNKAFRCGYVTRQIEVKVKYALWVTAAEKAAMTTVLGACPVGALGNTRVASSVQPTPPPTSNATTAQTPAPAAVPAPLAPVPAPGRDGYYPNCTAAKQAGAAPLRRGEPGYRAGLDRDNDGIACEK